MKDMIQICFNKTNSNQKGVLNASNPSKAMPAQNNYQYEEVTMETYDIPKSFPNYLPVLEIKSEDKMAVSNLP